MIMSNYLSSITIILFSYLYSMQYLTKKQNLQSNIMEENNIGQSKQVEVNPEQISVYLFPLRGIIFNHHMEIRQQRQPLEQEELLNESKSEEQPLPQIDEEAEDQEKEPRQNKFPLLIILFLLMSVITYEIYSLLSTREALSETLKAAQGQLSTIEQVKNEKQEVKRVQQSEELEGEVISTQDFQVWMPTRPHNSFKNPKEQQNTLNRWGLKPTLQANRVQQQPSKETQQERFINSITDKKAESKTQQKHEQRQVQIPVKQIKKEEKNPVKPVQKEKDVQNPQTKQRTEQDYNQIIQAVQKHNQQKPKPTLPVHNMPEIKRETVTPQKKQNLEIRQQNVLPKSFKREEKQIEKQRPIEKKNPQKHQQISVVQVKKLDKPKQIKQLPKIIPKLPERPPEKPKQNIEKPKQIPLKPRQNIEKPKIIPQKPKQKQTIDPPIQMIKQKDLIFQIKDTTKLQGYFFPKTQLSFFENKDYSQLHQPPPMTIVPPQPVEDFVIPAITWYFQPSSEKISAYVKKCGENIRHYSARSYHEVKTISASNYKKFLPADEQAEIDQTLAYLRQKSEKDGQRKLKESITAIEKTLIAFTILDVNGGVFIDSNLLLTEDFTWITKINSNQYVNKGIQNTTAKYFGFYNFDHGSIYERHNRTGINYETEKYMVRFPTMQPYFMVAIKEGGFLGEVLKQYHGMLRDSTIAQALLQDDVIKASTIRGNDLYNQIWYLAQYQILKRKQELIESVGWNKYDNYFAIDYYGIATMNQRYFPKKLDFLFEAHHEEKVYSNIARVSIQQLYETTGPLSYVVIMTMQVHINYRLQELFKGNEYFRMHPKSFLVKQLLINQTSQYVLKQFQVKAPPPPPKPWNSLPKTLWIYWDRGLEYTSLGNQLCVDNIIRAASLSGFQIKELTEENIDSYLGDQISKKIQGYLQNAKIKTFPQTKSDLARIAIIAKYGGVYMDASYFARDSLDWLININQQPNELIFNRFGQLPKAFMFFNPHYGQPYQWVYDRPSNTKLMKQTAYENNFFAAQPNNPLFWEWLEQFGRFISSPYQETQQLMKTYGTFSHSWTNSSNVYLSAMQSVKMVMGRRQKMIDVQISKDINYRGPRSSAQYYGVWSSSGYLGQQKLRSFTNFDNTYNFSPHSDGNVYLWRYSIEYVQGLIGRLRHVTKLYRYNLIHLNGFIKKNYDSNFAYEVHPNSYLAKYLFNPKRHRIVRQNDELTLYFI